MLHGDTYVKTRYHCDGYYNYGNMVPAETTFGEYWFGGKRLVYMTPRAKLILDMTINKLWIVNIPNKIYVEIPLPLLNPGKLIDKKILAVFAADRAGGSIKATGETKEIFDKKCRGFERKFQVSDQDAQFEDRIETMWMAVDPPFDIKPYRMLNAILLDIRHYVAHWDRGFVDGLKNTGGFPMAIHSTLYIKKTKRKASLEVIEMTEKTPGPEIYSIPGSYKKKEKLTGHFFHPFPYHGHWGILDM